MAGPSPFRTLLLAAALLAFASASGRAADPEAFPPCPATTTDPPDPDLDGFRAVLGGTAPIRILALGSGSTAGQGGRSDVTSYAEHMRDALAARLPGRSVTLDVRGGKGLTAADMLPLLRAALAGQHYALLLWQTGTVEAVQGLRPEDLNDALAEGSDAAIGAGTDVVLVDPQFSRFLRTNANLDPYEEVMVEVAALPRVLLFHRYDLTHAWADDGALDIERAEPADRLRVTAQVHRCLGLALADFVLAGAAPRAPEAPQAPAGPPPEATPPPALPATGGGN
jgi:hypothetical protein